MNNEYKKINLIYDHKELNIKEFEVDYRNAFNVKEFKLTVQKDGNYLVTILYQNKEKKNNAGRKKKVADKNFDTIIKLHNDGWSYEKIAKFYGITRNTLHNNLKRYKDQNDTKNEGGM